VIGGGGSSAQMSTYFALAGEARSPEAVGPCASVVMRWAFSGNGSGGWISKFPFSCRVRLVRHPTLKDARGDRGVGGVRAGRGSGAACRSTPERRSMFGPFVAWV
jgi:hypothetical protein